MFCFQIKVVHAFSMLAGRILVFFHFLSIIQKNFFSKDVLCVIFQCLLWLRRSNPILSTEICMKTMPYSMDMKYPKNAIKINSYTQKREKNHPSSSPQYDNKGLQEYVWFIATKNSILYNKTFILVFHSWVVAVIKDTLNLVQ